jgi:hypothetical protein
MNVEVTGELRRLHKEVLYDHYTLPNIIWVIKSRKMRWSRHLACMEDRKGGYCGLVGRPKERPPPWSPRRRWEDNVIIDLQEIWTGFLRLRAGTGGGLVRKLRFLKLKGFAWLAEELVACQEGHCSLELGTYLSSYLVIYFVGGSDCITLCTPAVLFRLLLTPW